MEISRNTGPANDPKPHSQQFEGLVLAQFSWPRESRAAIIELQRSLGVVEAMATDIQKMSPFAAHEKYVEPFMQQLEVAKTSVANFVKHVEARRLLSQAAGSPLVSDLADGYILNAFTAIAFYFDLRKNDTEVPAKYHLQVNNNAWVSLNDALGNLKIVQNQIVGLCDLAIMTNPNTPVA